MVHFEKRDSGLGIESFDFRDGGVALAGTADAHIDVSVVFGETSHSSVSTEHTLVVEMLGEVWSNLHTRVSPGDDVDFSREVWQGIWMENHIRCVVKFGAR